jgi:folate-binding protein YgfZ
LDNKVINYYWSVMSGLRCIELENRGVLTVAGREAADFLQGLVSNDVARVGAARAVYAALLTPQGKFLHDFIMTRWQDAFLLDCEAARLMDLGQRLSAYRLRADVELLDATEDWRVMALLGEDAGDRFGLAEADPGAAAPLDGGGLIYRDPRPQMPGLRALLPRQAATTPLDGPGISPGTAADYELARITAGVPDGSRDMTVGKATLMEFDFEALNGVDFEKGCYVGQELTARTKYRGLVRRRLRRVIVDGALPPPGTPVMADGKEAGEICSGVENQALALLRLDRSAAAEAAGLPLTAGTATLRLLENDAA